MLEYDRAGLNLSAQIELGLKMLNRISGFGWR